MANMKKLSKADARLIIECFSIKELTEPVWYKGRLIRQGINHQGLENWIGAKAARLISELKEYSKDERMDDMAEWGFREELRMKYNKEMKAQGFTKYDKEYCRNL